MNAPRLLRGFASLLAALILAVPMRAADALNSAYISEFVADNHNGLRDENRERNGWIELYNGGSGPVNLSGWYLTDTPTNLTRWRFPSVVLLPDKFIVVFASGNDRTNDLVHLHTNFRLNKKGGHIALVNRSTNIVSEFAPSYPKQAADISYGSLRDDPNARGSFVKPTPGHANSSSGRGFASEVTFSKSSFNFIEPFTLELSTSAKDAVIRYTRDGKLPSTNSEIYSAPLAITNTEHIRARSFQESLFPGPPSSEAYVNLSTNVLNFTSKLPILVMETFGKNIPVSANDSFVRLSLHEPVAGRTSLQNEPTLSTRAGLHVRGSTSSNFPQTPFALEFIDEFDDSRALPPLGMPADSDWVLYAPNAYDPVMIHNPFIHQLSRDMGRYSPRTHFVEVFLVRNTGPLKEAHYYGLYVLIEKIKIAKQRVNIERVGAEDLKPPQVTGGYVLKFDRVGPGESGFYGSGDRGLVYAEPKEQTLWLPQRAAQREYLQTYMGDFRRALHGPNWKDPKTGYAAYLDVNAAIDFHVLEVLSGNVDAMVLSTYFQKPRNGKIICGPHWDFDRALGSIDHRDANPRQWNTGPFFGGEWWPRLFSDPDFWQLWVDRWQELRTANFSLKNLCELIDRLTNEVRDAQPREYRRWGLQPRGDSYESEVEHMKDWLSNRVDFIDSQLVQPPAHHRKSDQLTFTALKNATIYYTLDGSDPRLSQGGVSSNAVAYTSPIQLKADAHVVARAYDQNQHQGGGPQSSTPWSRAVRINSKSPP